MLKAVIFDMDGVIIDSESVYLQICRRLFRNLGLNIPEEEYGNFVGISNPAMWSLIKDKYGLGQTVAELAALQAAENFNSLLNGEIPLVEGVESLISGLWSQGIAIGLASSSPEAQIRLMLEKFQLLKYFTVVVSGESLERGKPAPDIFLKAAALLKVEPSDCLVIEDSHHGVKAAKAAGMKCLGFRNPNSGNQDIGVADLVVDHLTGLSIMDLQDLF